MEKAGEKKKMKKEIISCPLCLFVVPRVRYVFRAMNEKRETRSIVARGSPTCRRSKRNHRAFFQGGNNEIELTKEHPNASR